MIRMVLLFLYCYGGNILSAQTPGHSFPSDWFGKWEGTLEIFSGPNLVDSIPMTLEIDSLQSSQAIKYFITYGEGEDALRPYYLYAVDTANGHYRLDENNGIVIDMYVLGNQLVSHFEVMNSYIQTASYRSGADLHYLIYSGSMESSSISGDTIIGSDTIPPVQIISYARASTSHFIQALRDGDPIRSTVHK